MADEIDLQEVGDLAFGEGALCREETAVTRLGARAIEGREQVGAVVGPEGPHFDGASVT